MNDPKIAEAAPAAPGPDEMMTALFAHLVTQQSQMALMLLGKTPHPETGQTVRDLEAARLFIDMLEMLEAKTRGNLSKEEAALLKQTLMALHMAFVEAVDTAPAGRESRPEPAAQAPSSAEPSAAPPAAEEEPRAKFTKKY